MTTSWIVAADAGRALVLKKITGGGISEGSSTILYEMENPEGRLHTSDIASDQRGRVEKRGGGVQSALEPPTDPHEQKAIRFSRKVCDLLDAAAGRGEFDSLYLIAPGHFLGLLKSGLGPLSRNRLANTLTRDLTHASSAELEEHIRDMIQASRTSASV